MPFPLYGELASVSAAILWAAALSTFRGFGHGIPAHALNLYKNSVALLCAGCALVVVRPEFRGDTEDYALLVMSGILGLAIGDTALFAALTGLGARRAALLQFLYAPMAVVFGVVVLGERLNAPQTTGVVITVVSVAGVIYFGRDRSEASGTSQLTTGVVLGLIVALSQSIGLIMARKAFANVGVLVGTSLRLIPAVMLLMAIQVVRQHAHTHRSFEFLRHPRQAIALSIAAIGGTFLGVLLISVGVKYAEAGIAATLTATFPIWILPVSHVFLGERSNWVCGLLTFLAVAGVAMIFLGRSTV